MPAILLALVLLAGCSAPPGELDADRLDASAPSDAPAADAGVPELDAATDGDAPRLDASRDARPEDAAGDDGGSLPLDSGADGGNDDAGSDAGADAGTDAGTPDAGDPCAPDEYEPNDTPDAAPLVFALGAPTPAGSAYDLYAMTWSVGDAADWISGTVAGTGPVVRVTAVADEHAGPPSLPALVTVAIRCRSGLIFCRDVASGGTISGQLCTSDARAGITYLDAGCDDPSMGIEVLVGATPRRAPDAPRCDHEVRVRVSVPE